MKKIIICLLFFTVIFVLLISNVYTLKAQSNISRAQKLKMCQKEGTKKFVGQESFIMDSSYRMVRIIRESLKLKCEYGELYTTSRVFNTYRGAREDLAWSNNDEDVICPDTVSKVGSICK